ncbi:MFS transporter [Amnibacterium sp.]|uniref:MFS transporter n=1 Tax=Amnibacterium sp. TaxID=1872496 RepID=UPI003F7B6E0C
MRTYGRLLQQPSTALSLIAALIGAVPIGMWPLGIVLAVLDRHGSAGEAGLLAAAFGIGNAVGVVTQGALLARVRAALLLPLFSLLGPVAAVLLAGDARIAGAVLAGLAIPAITPAVRGRFASSVPGRDRPGAYALVNVLFQAGIALGPIAAAALATAGRVGLVPPIAAAGGVLAALLLAVAHRGGAAGGVAPVGRVPGRGVLVLLGGAAAAGFGIGTLQVLVPLRTGAATSGATFAVLALAEVAGAVLLGGRVGPRHAFRLLALGSGGMALVYLLLLVGAPAVPAAVALGLATGTQSLGSALGLDRFVAPARIPTVFALQVALLIVAAAVGSLVAGAVPGVAYAAPALLLAAAAGATTAVRRRLGPLAPSRPAHAR